MSFVVRNLTPTAILLDDLGIEISASSDYDMLENPMDDVRYSAQVGGNLNTEITSGNLIVLDPKNGIVPLSKTDSIQIMLGINYLNYGNAGELVIQTAHGLTTGTPIYFTGISWQPAKADNVNTLATGVIDVISPDRFYVVNDGDIVGMSGLIVGDWYYVSDVVAGTITTTEPTGTYSNPIGYAISATKFRVQSIRAVDLIGASNYSGIWLQDNKKIHFGTNNNVELYYDGTNLILDLLPVNYNELHINSDVIGTDFVKTLSGTITRVAELVSSITKTGGRTLTIGRDINNRIQTINDGTRTFTFVRTNNKITSWGVL